MRTWMLAGAWLLVAAACPATGSLGKDRASGSDGGSEGEESESAGSSEGGDVSGDATDGTGTGSEGEPDLGGACEPDLEPDPCRRCQRWDCCDAWEACHLDDRCVCIVVCRLEGNDLSTCTTHCGLDHGEHTELLECIEAHCGAQCP